MYPIRIEDLWKLHHRKLHKFILNRVDDHTIVDDILQDVFLKIYKKSDTLNSNDRILSWIYQITRNTIIDFYRNRKPEYELPDSLNSPENDNAEKANQEMATCLLPMIQQLPELYHDAIMLSEIEGMKQNQVAKKLKLSVSGTKSRIQRGRLMLKALLLQCCHLEFDHKGKPVDYEEKSGACDRC